MMPHVKACRATERYKPYVADFTAGHVFNLYKNIMNFT